MGIFDACLFITDMDGTLVRSDNTISDRTIQALKYFVSEGGLFTIASGRPRNGTFHLISNLPVNAPIVCFNGAMIYDHIAKKTVYEDFLPNDMERVIVDVIETFPTVGVEGFNSDKACVFRNSEITTYHFNILDEKINIESTEIIDKNNWLKLFVTGEKEEVVEVMNYLRDKYPGEFSVIPSRPIFLEIFSKNCNKGNALKILKDHLGNIQTVYAAGDNYNDMPMLELADVSIVVDNGEKAIKETAGLCVPSNDEDGLAVAIERLAEQRR